MPLRRRATSSFASASVRRGLFSNVYIVLMSARLRRRRVLPFASPSQASGVGRLPACACTQGEGVGGAQRTCAELFARPRGGAKAGVRDRWGGSRSRSISRLTGRGDPQPPSSNRTNTRTTSSTSTSNAPAPAPPTRLTPYPREAVLPCSTAPRPGRSSFG